MGCCGGEREKFGNLSEEQKWEYIVRLSSVAHRGYELTRITESRRFQIIIMLDSFRLRLPDGHAHRLHFRLRCRYIYRY
jgi:hypothetical protein